MAERERVWISDFGSRISDFGFRMSDFELLIYRTQREADESYKVEGIEEGVYNLATIRQRG